MTVRKAPLGELESLVLLAVLRLAPDASSVAIREEVAERGDRKLSRGALYATLSRLERKGFLEVGPNASAEGARTVRRFALTDAGLLTLRTAYQNLSRMQAGLESLLEMP